MRKLMRCHSPKCKGEWRQHELTADKKRYVCKQCGNKVERKRGNSNGSD